MKKKLILIVALIAAVAVISGGLAIAVDKEKPAANKGSVLYVCNCGPDCKCNTVATKPGNCTCGTKLAPMHVLKIENGEAILCTCGAECTCTLNAADPTKCGCGKPVKVASLKGMYVCNCGPDCKCNTVSDKPGKCVCSSELKKVS
jgi:hypothetical protein